MITPATANFQAGQVLSAVLLNGALNANNALLASLSKGLPGATVLQYGAVGDGVTDDAASIQAAINANTAVLFPPGYTFAVGSTIALRSGSLLIMYGAAIVLKAAVNNHVFLIEPGSIGVTIQGGEINGNMANNTGGHGITTSAAGTGGSRIHIEDVYAHSCAVDGIRIDGTTAVQDVKVLGCSAYSNGAAGITANDIDGFIFSNNSAFYNGTHGIGIIGVATDGVISDNVAESNGPGADNFTGYNNLNDNIVISNNVSKFGGNNGIHFGGTNIAYIGNVDEGSAQYGIVHYGQDAFGVHQHTSGVLMIGNRVKGPIAQAGFWWDRVDSGTFQGNSAEGNVVGVGMTFSTVTDAAIIGNTFKGLPNNGIRISGGCARLSVSGNVCTGNSADGIFISDTTLSSLVGNTCTGNGQYGIAEGGASDYNLISPNMLHGNTSGPVSVVGAHTVSTPNLT